MERRGCSLGCSITFLGLLLLCCLLPYLVSSIYSIITELLQVPGTPDWLWGDWIHTVVGDSGFLYMVMSEGPICCVSAVGLLIVIVGLVLAIGGIGPSKTPDTEETFYAEEVYEAYPEFDEQ